MDILQQTLPAFFNTGLVATNYHLPLHMHSILGATHKGKGRADEHECETCDEEGIYARTIRLEYTPPVALPAPLPRMLKVDGKRIVSVLSASPSSSRPRPSALRRLVCLPTARNACVVHRSCCRHPQSTNTLRQAYSGLLSFWFTVPIDPAK